MNNPEDLKYTPSHEWIRLEDDGSLTVGITDFAQDQLGDLVFVESPQIDSEVAAGDPCAVVESVKAASDIYAPVDGMIVDANPDLGDEPELVNSDPYGRGWLYRIQPSNVEQYDQLLDAEQYAAVAAEQG